MSVLRAAAAVAMALAVPTAAMAAGNVTAQVVDGDLLVRGDPQHNSISIYSEIDAATDDRVVVVEGTRGTKVNGADRFHAPLPAGGLDVDMDNGNDRLGIQEYRPAFMRLDLGKGHDSLSVFDAGPEGDATILLRGGRDAMTTDGMEVGGDLRLDMGAGKDEVDFTLLTEFGGTTEIEGGTGSDALELSDATFRGPTTIDLGRHNDDLTGESAVFEDAVSLEGGEGRRDEIDFENPPSFAEEPEVSGFESISGM